MVPGHNSEEYLKKACGLIPSIIPGRFLELQNLESIPDLLNQNL